MDKFIIFFLEILLNINLKNEFLNILTKDELI
jgi:hypothetical protein